MCSKLRPKRYNFEKIYWRCKQLKIWLHETDVLILFTFYIIKNSGYKWKNTQYKTKKEVNILCKN